MQLDEFQHQFSNYLTAKIPCLFIIDFECNECIVVALDEAKTHGIYYDIQGKTNYHNHIITKTINLEDEPISKDIFTKSFNKVKEYLDNGYTYLLNLTFPSQIQTSLSLKEIFQLSFAPYKLLYKDQFVVFSPECFIKIHSNEIFTFPMKGTIDASISNAEALLLNNKKEEWEHNTIVDLLRNDLALIANNIELTKYRYIDRIKTIKNEILQTSSEIKGTLPTTWQTTFAKDIFKLLPAGSISGAPKQKTIHIIQECEISERGFYTGIFGIFDGKDIDSAVAIRFIEQKGDKQYFRSGGGITSNSNIDEEYEELIQKIYIPKQSST